MVALHTLPSGVSLFREISVYGEGLERRIWVNRVEWLRSIRPDARDMSIDDGAAENTLRPVYLGRTNYLQLGSDRGGRAAAVLMSLLQSSSGLGKRIDSAVSYVRDNGDGPPPRDSRTVEASSMFTAMA
jgi:hypothetical protein